MYLLLLEGGVRNVTVYCKDCGKELAWWDMFTNRQYEEEWECIGKFRRKILEFASTHNRKSRCTVQTGEYQVPIHSEMAYCSLHRHTRYCRTCAYKRQFKCGAHKCTGQLVKVRNRDGSCTKHTHGGW